MFTRISVAENVPDAFSNENVDNMTMQQLRGRKGRASGLFIAKPRMTLVSHGAWEYNPDNYEAGDTINKALSAAHACLYVW